MSALHSVPTTLEGKSGTAATSHGADEEQHQIRAIGDGLRTGLSMYVCMYVCMVITHTRERINRVRLPILLVVIAEQGN